MSERTYVYVYRRLQMNAMDGWMDGWLAGGWRDGWMDGPPPQSPIPNILVPPQFLASTYQDTVGQHHKHQSHC